MQFINMSDDSMSTLSNLFFRLPFSPRMEMETDHIGLMLLAAAGYDPRVAPGVYEKLGKIGGDSELRSYLSTHPSSKTRSQILSQDHVMNEALDLYRKFRTSQGTEGVF
uniref:Peptidase M48 domain-containing protein n=1 Tax=Arundo donax TaxID=35708 RepID=A0A0A8ZRE1_ARUDO